MAIKLYAPDSLEPPFLPENVPYDGLMGKWHVVASTLPMWKGKKNVTITYAALPGEPTTTFDDIVQYHGSLDADPSTKRKTVKGIDRLDSANALRSGEPGDKSGSRWKWRGRGWLMIASSHWQLLGYDLSEPEQAWAVTYFSKTLFTPAGLDVYARSGTSLSEETRRSICQAAKESTDPEISKLAATLFDIPHDM